MLLRGVRLTRMGTRLVRTGSLLSIARVRPSLGGRRAPLAAATPVQSIGEPLHPSQEHIDSIFDRLPFFKVRGSLYATSLSNGRTAWAAEAFPVSVSYHKWDDCVFNHLIFL